MYDDVNVLIDWFIWKWKSGIGMTKYDLIF